MGAGRVGMCAQVSCRALCCVAGVYLYAGEIVPEAKFHVLAQRRIKRAARAGERTVHAGGCGRPLLGWRPGEAMHVWWCRTDHGMGWGSQDPIRDPVGFPFQRIVSRADRELTLQDDCISRTFAAWLRVERA